MAIWMSPIMTFFISLSSSAGLGLYFYIGGLFAILQTLMIHASRQRIRKRIEEEQKKHPIKMPKAPMASQSSTASAIDQLKQTGTPAQSQTSENRNRQRNAGKQQHHSD